MPRITMRSLFSTTFAAAAVAAADVAAAQPVQTLKARCDQLIRYFDYYGQSRSEGVSDGARNMRRISARIDCDRGDYEQGIAMMETLLRNKRMGVPAPE